MNWLYIDSPEAEKVRKYHQCSVEGMSNGSLIHGSGPKRRPVVQFLHAECELRNKAQRSSY